MKYQGNCFFTTCFDCNTHICTYCNDNWHEGLSCHEFQTRAARDNEETSKYIQNYCKRCPNCNVVVQKIQTREQELYEKRTGMAGGTSECHHVTCDNCKRDLDESHAGSDNLSRSKLPASQRTKSETQSI